MIYDVEEDKNNKLRSSDRIVVLEPMDGKKSLNTSGLVDTRLFTGRNQLHIIMDPQTCLWSFKYESGILPDPLKQRFTSFRNIYDYAVEYFRKRNIKIVEVID